ncbi:MAG: hypothetical protein RQ748_09885 [Elusimicrobiales bacterium]|nr:hypothetical protein [Elusimicrobiales bacterium]
MTTKANDKGESPIDPEAVTYYSLKEGAQRTGHNLHYFRRLCRAGRFACTADGCHIKFTYDQFFALPPAAPRIKGAVAEDLDAKLGGLL